MIDSSNLQDLSKAASETLSSIGLQFSHLDIRYENGGYKFTFNMRQTKSFMLIFPASSVNDRSFEEFKAVLQREIRAWFDSGCPQEIEPRETCLVPLVAS